MIFIDSSAMVSMIAREADCYALTDRLQASSTLCCSAVSIWETIAALSYSYQFQPLAAKHEVAIFRQDFGLQWVSIGEPESDLAAVAYAKFGKGRHPAALNMGDCFAYACAKANNAKLLFKGEDFSKTDIAVA
jgi:ribonuclease VapC